MSHRGPWYYLSHHTRALSLPWACLLPRVQSLCTRSSHCLSYPSPSSLCREFFQLKCTQMYICHLLRLPHSVGDSPVLCSPVLASPHQNLLILGWMDSWCPSPPETGSLPAQGQHTGGHSKRIAPYHRNYKKELWTRNKTGWFHCHFCSCPQNWI